METLKIGSLCFYDSMAGLIPCKVAGAHRDERGFIMVDLIVTSRKGGVYVRGDKIQTSTKWAIPRKSVKVRSGIKKITPYNVEVI
jgi:hypothetical protein